MHEGVNRGRRWSDALLTVKGLTGDSSPHDQSDDDDPECVQKAEEGFRDEAK